ncbi:V0D/AC39 family V-type ATPase subunit [Treponema pectinovorum]|uniref:V0D/AC39 family V-type ATPase subunit n=1 Tax=Treponema pectinovorum TaxID=164 RepID=UPI0011C7B851|nr:V-type ATPase subunit [Treponema pectinovorum]
MMDKSAANAYVYAKVCGKLSKAYFGQRAQNLYAAKSLTELYNILFKGDVPAIPENLLAKKIEEKAERRFVKEYCSLLECYSNPEKILLTLLQFYDYDNLKEIGGALCLKETERPYILDLKRYAILNYDKWPDIKKITEGSELAWYNTVPNISNQQVLDTKLDFQYLRKLWQSVNEIEYSCREEACKLFSREIEFSNILWTLRLMVYYKMKPEEIMNHLFFENPSLRESDRFARESIKLLKKDPNDFKDWKDWKFNYLLNPHEEGVIWEVDPRWVENSINAVLIKNYSTAFHRFPLTSLSLVCYFKIKHNELDNIRRVTEDLRLGGQ